MLKKLTQVLDTGIIEKGYNTGLDFLDKNDITPNDVVYARTVGAIAVGGILAYNPDLDILTSTGLTALGCIMLALDRTDGDLARRTNQTSKAGEILDATADKVIVYSILGMILANLPNNIDDITKYSLMVGVSVSAVLDIASTAHRGFSETINAIKSSWKPALSKEERIQNENRPKSKDAANDPGKYKTVFAMGAIGIGLEGISSLDPSVRTWLISTAIYISIALSGASLHQKMKKK